MEVGALLLPPPQQAQQAPQDVQQAEQAERGTVLLELVSPDGQQRWQAQAEVSTPPAGSSGGPSGACPWQLLADGGTACAAEGDGEPAPAPAPVPVRHTLRLLVDEPQLWWPHDFGRQPLYELRVTYTPGAASASPGRGAGPAAEGTGAPAAEGSAGPAAESNDAGTPAAESGGGAPAAEGAGRGGSSSFPLVRRIGLRRVELVTEELSRPAGETFFFRVNGQPVYARGACCMPGDRAVDALCSRRRRLLLFRRNMLRGGTCSGQGRCCLGLAGHARGVHATCTHKTAQLCHGSRAPEGLTPAACRRLHPLQEPTSCPPISWSQQAPPPSCPGWWGTPRLPA